MPIIQRSYFDAAQKGRDAAQSEQTNALLNRQRQQDIEQTDYTNNLARQNAPIQAQAEQAKEFATQMTTAIRYAKGSSNPKALIERNFPMLVQTFGPEWATATDDQVRAELDGAEAKFGTQAGIAPQQTKAPDLINGVGPDGKPVRVADKPGAPVYVPPQKPAAGDSFDPDSVENTAQMVANNQIPMLSGFALKSKWGQAVVSRVRELNPQYAGADYGSNAAGLKQFTSGKNGNTIRSLNVAVQHLDQLSQLATAMGNGDTPLFNKVAVAWKKQTGQAAPTNFETAKKIVADEIVKAIVGSGGGVADREEAARSINSAGSPEQLQQAINTYTGLMTGQLNGIRQQYQTATGRDNFETLLLPETRARLEAHGAQQAPTGAAPAAEQTATNPKTGQKLALRNGQWVPL